MITGGLGILTIRQCGRQVHHLVSDIAIGQDNIRSKDMKLALALLEHDVRAIQNELKTYKQARDELRQRT